VDSFGQHKPETVVREAISQLDKKVDELSDAFKAIAK